MVDLKKQKNDLFSGGSNSIYALAGKVSAKHALDSDVVLFSMFARLVFGVLKVGNIYEDYAYVRGLGAHSIAVQG